MHDVSLQSELAGARLQIEVIRVATERQPMAGALTFSPALVAEI